MRRHLTYQNVVATIALALMLATGTAFAASKLAKNSVGTKQLKKNAVTTAKIKKNAVTAAKIKAKAVTNAKIADGTIPAAAVNAAGTPFSRVVARLASTTPTPWTDSKILPALGTYTQPAGEDDQYLAYADFAFDPSCTGERQVTIYLLVDVGPVPSEPDLAAVGTIYDENGTIPGGRIELTALPGLKPMSSPAPSSPVTHNFTFYLDKLTCKAGNGGTITGTGVEVIGTPSAVAK